MRRRLLALLALLASSVAGAALSGETLDAGGKVSADLQALVQEAGSALNLPVILQTDVADYLDPTDPAYPHDADPSDKPVEEQPPDEGPTGGGGLVDLMEAMTNLK